MIVYVTRHGQPAIGDLPAGVNHEFPPGDPTLTELGLKQAAYLGAFLKKQNFKGSIYSSPYHRTLYTAHEVAKATGALIHPEKAIQEYVLQEGTPDIQTATLPEIKSLLSHISPSATLDDDWLFAGPEAIEDVRERVRPFINNILCSDGDDCLLVGHGASVGACKTLLFEAGNIEYVDEYNWNCSLSKYIIENGKTIDVELNCDISFMPEESVTSNKLVYLESDMIK
jgi:broad specificity phosphatase PhoE